MPCFPDRECRRVDDDAPCSEELTSRRIAHRNADHVAQRRENDILPRAARCVLNWRAYRRFVLLWTSLVAIGTLPLSFCVAAEPTASLTSTRPGEDWPVFLGPRGDNTSTESGLIEQFSADGPPRLWSREIGTGYAPPSVQGERLVVHHRRRDREIVECLHAQTGETLWSADYETNFSDPYGYNGGSRCAPLLTATRCYTFGPQGKLLCVELDTGRTLWQRDTATDWDVPEHFFGAGCTPLLDGNRLFVLVGGQPDAAVIAFDADTGKTLWQAGGKSTWNGVKTDTGKPFQWKSGEMLVSYSSPHIATIHGQQHLLCLLRQGLVSLDPATGDVRFAYWFRSRTHESVNAARPLVQGSQILLTAAYETGSALLDVQPDGKSVKELLRDRRGLSAHWTTPLRVGNSVYGFSGRHEQDAELQCRDWSTGRLNWSSSGYDGDLGRFEQDPRTGKLRDKQTKQSVPWPFYGRGSAILADGRLFVLGERGTLALVKPNDTQLQEVCRAQIAGIGYPSWAAPVLSRGRLFLRAEEQLVALDVLAPAKKPSP
jgi:outer membrane protein assembly factor BamB